MGIQRRGSNILQICLTFRGSYTACIFCEKVSMIRKYHSHILQTNLAHHEEEQHNTKPSQDIRETK